MHLDRKDKRWKRGKGEAPKRETVDVKSQVEGAGDVRREEAASSAGDAVSLRIAW